MRSDLASEAVWRPKQPQKNLLEKIRMLSQSSSSVNEFQKGQITVNHGIQNESKTRYPPPLAAAGLLGPDLVFFGGGGVCMTHQFWFKT